MERLVEYHRASFHTHVSICGYSDSPGISIRLSESPGLKSMHCVHCGMAPLMWQSKRGTCQDHSNQLTFQVDVVSRIGIR